MIFDKIEAVELIKKHRENPPKWIIDSRLKTKTLRALVNGVNFHDELINNIEKITREDRKRARKKYVRDIRDVFVRVLSVRDNVFSANGNSEVFIEKNQRIVNDLKSKLDSFNNIGLSKFLNKNYFSLSDVDPNGILLTFNDDEIVKSVFKSIDDIRFYETKGRKLSFLILEPKEVVNDNSTYRKWTLIDDNNVWIIKEISNVFIVSDTESYEHLFGEVPAIVLSSKKDASSELRYSYLESIIELSKDYAKDKSMLCIYKAQKGAPFHWRFGKICKTCSSTGEVNGTKCDECKGASNSVIRGDVTDIHIVPIPKEGQGNAPVNMMGFSSSDLETWTQLNEDLINLDDLIYRTFWNTTVKKHASGLKTATQSIIDLQPIQTALNEFTNDVEYTHNFISNLIAKVVYIDKKVEDIYYVKIYGRRYIIESPDVLNEKYQKAKKAGDNNAILDKILEEIIFSIYKNDYTNQELMIKKSKVEPHVHLSIIEVNTLFGREEASIKSLFKEYWDQETNKDKDFLILKERFKEYANNNKLEELKAVE